MELPTYLLIFTFLKAMLSFKLREVLGWAWVGLLLMSPMRVRFIRPCAVCVFSLSEY